MPKRKLTIAANQGEFGGGEVMLIAIAQAARELGYAVTVLAPATPDAVVKHAQACGFDAVAIPSRTRAEYLINLKLWDLRHREGLLWCNGLRPSLATAGHRNRVVHLHQQPQGLTGKVVPVARSGAKLTVVPSHFMTRFVRGSSVLWNWTASPSEQRIRGAQEEPRVVGYMGRLSTSKGVDVLCSAVNDLSRSGHEIKLLLAGEARFISDEEQTTIENVIKDLNVTSVERRGWTNRDEFFNAVDVAVFPSVAPESFGLVVAEAMAAKCPFIITDSGALPEVAGYDYPFTAPAKDAPALAELLKRALNEDWHSQIAASYTRWADNFTADAGRARLAAILDSIEEN